MQDVIDDNDLTEEADDFWIQDTENSGFWLGMDSDYDESSDEEDPMTTLIQENAENASVQHFLQLAQSMCEVGQIRLDLERARMQLEDRRRRGDGAECNTTRLIASNPCPPPRSRTLPKKIQALKSWRSNSERKNPLHQEDPPVAQSKKTAPI